MAGLIVIFLLSIILLRIFKIPFSAFGLKPNKKRLKNFIIGFTISAVVCAVYFFLIITTLDYDIIVNSNYSLTGFFYGFWWTLRSVLMEELIFRGALFILAIKLIGERKAILLSAVVFGIYHWFSYNVFGNLLPMMNTFITTSIGGLMFAYAYAKTRSLYFPIALHFGWNLLTITVFSEGPLGDQLLISSGGKPMGYLYFGFLLYQILILPLFTFYYLKMKNLKAIPN